MLKFPASFTGCHFPTTTGRSSHQPRYCQAGDRNFQMQKSAQDERILTENARGTAVMQAELAQSKVGVDIKTNMALARKAEANGEATYISETGTAKGAEVRAVGMARAEAYQAQVNALGQMPTALVNAVIALSESKNPIVPQVLSAGDGGMLQALAGTLTQKFVAPETKPVPAEPPIITKTDNQPEMVERKSSTRCTGSADEITLPD